MSPTASQLRYLRDLANRTGTTFTAPATKAAASAELRRLKRLSPSHPGERRREQRETIADVQAGRDDATRYQPDEIRGYGSSAQWAHTAPPRDSDADPALENPIDDEPTPKRRKLPVSQGKRVELARYDTPTGPRRIIGQRRYDIPHLFDEPTTQIEPVIELGTPRSKAELEQILANHLNTRR